ncbi:MAG: preprotein translocase subunit SecG [Candidatus Woykebacteria bacterium RBG_19FT_COMBO_43_10]|uniref:Protein-export membrane protein SecG n=1 Tax=Candidatus Woykebacteria bacterium RBG_19FT_COMBO_43_10 TaxID=1802598 RepID=A0A1G1WKD5_9BACT|nr:MAG: preprotein translocase subunit SecG [Candidatus Woykebacteria bacterium RBG_19FT_COMBO_43_10]
MRIFFLILLILIAGLLITLILLQQKGSGAGSVFGGGGGDVYRTRRGIDKLLHYLTIILAFLYSAVSFSLIFLR